MIKRAAYVGFLVLALLCAAQARKKAYEQGELIDLSPKYIEAPFSSITLLPPPRILIGYEFQIQVGDNTYFVAVATCCPPPSRQYKVEWAVGDPVQFRVDKHKMFVRWPNGKELNARLVKVVPGIASPSLSPPSVSSGHQFPLPLDEAPRNKKLPLTVDFLRAEDMCLILFGTVGAGDFFDHVRSRKTANGVQFRKGSQVVTTFPESLVVSIIAVLGKCSARERAAQADDASQKNVRFDENFMESVTFDGTWKEGFAEKPAELGPLAEGRIPDPTRATNDHDWWEYQFKVRSEGVSLAHALVIVIHSPDGKTVARFSARLTPKS
jgi:hypothetical protein